MSASSPPTRSAAAERWDLIIRPAARWFDLSLGELWRYRDLVMEFVRRDFAAQYKQTILGPIWFVLQPLLTTVVFVVVFGRMAGLATDGRPQLLFYLSGQVVWGYFSGVLTATATTFVSNAHIFGKVYFPRLAVPLSIVLSQLLQFGLRLALFAVFWLYYLAAGADARPTGALWLFPLLVLMMAGQALGLGILFSAMTTKYRDLRFLLTFGVQLLMYISPAVLPLAAVHGRYRLVMLINPMTPVMEAFRSGFMGGGQTQAGHLAYSAAFALAAPALGVWLFTRIERTFMDTV